MEDSIFTKIIKGEIPCHKVYEDNKTLVFMDIDPFLPGHVLVVPKVQVDHFDDLKEADYQAVFATVRKVAKRLKEVLGAKRAILQVLGYDVPHAHVHVIPSDTGREFMQSVTDHLQRDTAPEPDHPALAELAQKLYFE